MRSLDLSDPSALESAIRPETRMVLVESPTNPLLRLVDPIEARNSLTCVVA